MKSVRPPLAAIFFMTYFYTTGEGGAWPPWPLRIRYWVSRLRVQLLHDFLERKCVLLSKVCLALTKKNRKEDKRRMYRKKIFLI